MEKNPIYNELQEYVKSIGIHFFDSAEEKRFLEITIDELENRIGMELLLHCSEEELREFQSISDSELENEWLSKHYPAYREVVKKQKELLRDEIKTYKEEIKKRQRMKIRQNKKSLFTEWLEV